MNSDLRPSNLVGLSVATEFGLDPMGATLQELAQRHHGLCLIEAADGRLVGHHLLSTSVPTCVTEAVLAKSILPVQRASGQRTTFGLVPGGPVQRVAVDGWPGPGYVVPLLAAEVAIGWWWLLCGSKRRVSTDNLARGAQALARSAIVGDDETATDSEVLSVLWSADPNHCHSPILRSAQLWVVAVVGPDSVPTIQVLRAVRRAAAGMTAKPVAHTAVQHDGVIYLLLGTAAAVDAVAINKHIEAVVGSAGDLLRCPLRASLGGSVATADQLPTVRAKADLALQVAPCGRCVTFESVRPAIVLARTAAALEEIPCAQHDPVRELLAYDVRRHSELAPALLGWLDAHGDVVLVAAVLGVHHNTLRYRLRRATEVANVDLSDASQRLELHLRLRAARRNGMF